MRDSLFYIIYTSTFFYHFTNNREYTMFKKYIILVVIAGLFSCSPSTRASRPAGSTANIIAGEELSSTSAANAYQLIENLRPNWMRVRTQRSIRLGENVSPVIYVNRSRYGTIDSLRDISTLNLRLVEYLSPNDATTRYGGGHGGGAILLTISF